MNNPEYQNDLSLKSPILLDYEYKRHKVDKMLAILRESGGIGDDRKRLALDVGCSGGFFTSAIAPYFEDVLGLDIDLHALKIANQQRQRDNLHYVDGDSMRLPLKDGSVDLVICNHVYEHVPDPVRLFQEIRRVLADEGVCYLGAASRWIPMEPHYHLLFLSWLPKFLAHRYMKLFGKGDYYYENLRTYGGIRKLIRDFRVEDYTLRVLEDPDRFHARDMIPRGGKLERVPMWFWKLFYRLLPTYVLILRR